jgi:chromosome partitioning protein
MKNIAVIARKGGSGKTTVAVNLAIAAHRRNYKVRLADTDPQGSSTEVLNARKIAGPEALKISGGELFDAQKQADASEADITVIDTPAGSEEAVAHAIALANVSLLVVRPTFLDIAATLQTAHILRRLRRPGLILLNQAPTPRGGVEPPAVKRALEALRLMQLPVAPIVIRARAVYQNSLTTGRSAEELEPGNAAAEEIGRLWTYIERFALGTSKSSAVA